MTMRMAKGLELPVEFLTGCDGDLLPCTIIKEGMDKEEERRFFYSGMTRAKNELFLTLARCRFYTASGLLDVVSLSWGNARKSR